MKFRILYLLSIVLLLSQAASAGDITPDEQDLVDRVVARLVAKTDPPPNTQWPPVIRIVPVDSINAMCLNTNPDPTGQVQPEVRVYQGLMEQIIMSRKDGQEDRLAFVIGHEMTHAILGHIVHHPDDPRARSPFTENTFTREQEFAADKGGSELAARAGFSYQGAIDAMKMMNDNPDLKYSSFEGLGYNHPSWTERLARIDKNQPRLWRAIGAFDSGTDLLLLEQYGTAINYYQRVIDRYPDCAEAWANIGYARLMLYCDKLNADDLRNLGVSQMVVGGFYQRPDSLIGQVRGVDHTLWQQAVDALNQALKLNPNLTLAQANLGVAYLVAPDGKDVESARGHLSEASKQLAADVNLNPSIQTAILINSGVADLAAGELDSARAHFLQAESLDETAVQDHRPFGVAIASALLYNRASMLADSTLADNRQQAVDLFNKYFQTADPGGAWWPQAYERYAGLCKAVGVQPDPEADLRNRAIQRKRPITAITISSGQQVTLGETFDELHNRLTDKPDTVPEVPGTSLLRLCYPDKGLDVIGIREVLAICLHGSNAPPVILRDTELGSQPREIRPGMLLSDLEAILGPTNSNPDDSSEALTDPDVTYTVYRDLNLAVRTHEGRIDEIVVGIVPEKRELPKQ